MKNNQYWEAVVTGLGWAIYRLPQSCFPTEEAARTYIEQNPVESKYKIEEHCEDNTIKSINLFTMDGEEIIYMDDIKGVCPFCGCTHFHINTNQIAADEIDFINATCGECLFTFPFRQSDDINPMDDDDSIPF